MMLLNLTQHFWNWEGYSAKKSFFITLLQWLQNIAYSLTFMSSFYRSVPSFKPIYVLFLQPYPHLHLSISSLYSSVSSFKPIYVLLLQPYPHLHLSVSSFLQLSFKPIFVLFYSAISSSTLLSVPFLSSVSSFTPLSVLFLQLCILIYTSICPLFTALCPHSHSLCPLFTALCPPTWVPKWPPLGRTSSNLTWSRGQRAPKPG